MCGIVGGISQREVSAILLEGLRRLEYRGYDSAGMAVLSAPNVLKRVRTLGKVQRLAEEMEQNPLPGTLGIAHTRWATHGEPSQRNAHPHVCRARCAIVHNGIRVGSPGAASCPRHLATTLKRSSRRSRQSRSSPAAPASTQAWCPAIGSSPSPACPATWRWPASTATASTWCPKEGSLSR